MGPGWVRWMVTLWESENRCELVASYGVFPVNLQMDPRLAKWTFFYQKNGMEVRLGRQKEDPWGVVKWAPDQGCGRGWGWEIYNGPRLGEPGGDLVGNCGMGMSMGHRWGGF